MREVAIQSCGSYHIDIVYEAVQTAWEAIGIPELTGKRVLLKPNVLSDKPAQKAATTHPSVLEAVCRIILERGGTPLIGDSPAIQQAGFTPDECGIQEVCDRLSVPWVDFTDGTTIVRHGRNTFRITSIINEVDYIINLPKMKTHQFMFYTGAVKNLFGLIPSLNKSPYHLRYRTKRQFSKMILDLYRAVPVEVHIMDAVITMEGPGPGNGSPKKIGAILASKDGIALDTAAVSIMGESPSDIPILNEALKQQLIPSLDQDDISFPLSSIGSFYSDDYILIDRDTPTGFVSIALNWLSSRFRKPVDPPPFIIDDRCISCRKCQEICPANAISDEPKMFIHTGACIRCYCCHEICPVDAIEIQGT